MADGGFHHGQREGGHPQAISLDDVGVFQIASAEPGPAPPSHAGVSRNGDLDDGRRTPCEAVHPRRGEATSCRLGAVLPDAHTDACGVGEWPVVGEIYAARAPTPATGRDTSVDRVLVQSAAFSLGQRDDAVLATQISLHHTRNGRAAPSTGSISSDLWSGNRAHRGYGSSDREFAFGVAVPAAQPDEAALDLGRTCPHPQRPAELAAVQATRQRGVRCPLPGK